MVLAETIVGKIGIDLVLRKKKAKWQEIAKDFADTLCLCLWPGIEKGVRNTHSLILRKE